jgi:uncharacterized membrane protein YhaH (DUF805 family)
MNLNSLIEPIKNIFIGKTNRRDFLIFHIVLIEIMFSLILIDNFFLFNRTPDGFIVLVAVIISFVLQIRRMNDIGKNGLFLLKLYWNYIILISLSFLIIHTSSVVDSNTYGISCIDNRVHDILMYLNHPDKNILNIIKDSFKYSLKEPCYDEKFINHIGNIEYYTFNFITTIFVIILAYFLFKKSNTIEKIT